ncbi:helix-turn-helix domain-containing protein [Streptomyces sp. NA04227]|uniref:helix-turn-helix domain-containing protein n=1 Tax=Streptomyces sp. NA04227 TaxID=2742136 RepID=UPI00159037AB|nr:helix-turn-helix domain-containing protein [Streptomyces sp. NA04227]QKW09174.1 helix-turn-helix domain-containing protein [Streptomyces sp. NA04227]
MIDDLEFNGEELTRAERFDAWMDMARASIMPAKLTSDAPLDCDSLFDGAMLGPVMLLSASAPPLKAVRTPRLITADDPEMYELAMPYQGQGILEQAGRTAVYGPGSLMVASTSLPFESHGRLVDGRLAFTKFYLPRKMVPIPPDKVERLLATPLSTSEGMGALFAKILRNMVTDAASLGDSDRARLGTVVTDMFTAFVAHHLEEDSKLPPESQSRTLFLRVKDFIRHNLHDPELSADTVAAAHHISSRYLYRLFQENGLTVRSWIRTQRLEECARALGDPVQLATPINELALRWGFSHPAAFSRAFREAYGVSPRDYRMRQVARAVA